MGNFSLCETCISTNSGAILHCKFPLAVLSALPAVVLCSFYIVEVDNHWDQYICEASKRPTLLHTENYLFIH